MKKAELSLVLAGPSFSELVEIRFYHPLTREKTVATRGKTSGAYPGYGTFQCTKAVLALCCVFANAVLKRRCIEGAHAPDICGERGSLASSLDYALSKLPLWLVDSFGSDSRGVPNCRRLFLISNPGQKRPGAVALRLNESFLPSNCIKFIYPNGEGVSATALQAALREDSLRGSAGRVAQDVCSGRAEQTQMIVSQCPSHIDRLPTTASLRARDAE